MPTTARALLATVLILLAGSGIARADESTLPVDILRAGAEAGVANGLPGAIGLIRRDAETAYVHAGYGELSTRTPADPTARFRIGSFTKAFVAVVVLQLAAEHRLTIDDPIDRWVPGAVPGNAGITIRQLLDHTSGLPEYANDPRVAVPYLAGVDPRRQWSPQALVDLALPWGRMGAPGERFFYANTNYLLAGMVIAAVTGNDPAVEVHDRIIEPLHLRDTSFPTTDPEIHGNRLHGYTWQRDISSASPLHYGAAGAMISTLDDFAIFARALYSGALLPPEQQRDLTTTVPSDVGGYGLGILHVQLPCGPAWAYNGLVLGYDSRMITSADGSRLVVLTGNEYHLLAGTPGNAALNKSAVDTFCAL